MGIRAFLIASVFATFNANAHAGYVRNDPVNNIDPNGQDTISVNFYDQAIHARGIVLPQAVSQGHSGAVLVRPNGQTEYHEYGRYPNSGDVRGAVRQFEVSDLTFENGIPTTESLTNLVTDLIGIGENAGASDIRLNFNLGADNVDAMKQESENWDQSVEYSVAGNKTCHGFCRAMEAAGGGNTNNSRAARKNDDSRFQVSVNPNDIGGTVEEIQNRYKDYGQ